MTQNGFNGNENGAALHGMAPLTNVSLCSTAMLRATERPIHLPGLVCFYGPAGWGKSKAAAYVTNTQDAYYIQCMESWTRKAVLHNILHVMGIPPRKTIYEMVDQICEQLASSGRPLIVDEFDHLVKRDAVEMIRDIYEGSLAAILLIGEELLPDKLSRWERFHSRVLDWIPAQPADFDDCQELAKLYAPEISIGESLLRKIHKLSDGSARRIVTNIELVRKEAVDTGQAEISIGQFDERKVFTGKAPARRLY
jgi:DNA transposition AAA+ family ATPase